MQKYYFKLFARIKPIYISYIVLLLISNMYLIYQLQWIEPTRFSMYLLKTQGLGIVGFIFFMFIAYELFVNVRRVHLEETIHTIRNGKLSTNINQLCFLIVPIFIITLVISAYNVGTYLFFNINHMPYLVHIIKSIVLNITVPSIIGSLIGALLAFRIKRIMAYLIMIIVSFIISPAFENVVSIFRVSDIYDFWDFFRVLSPNLDWEADALYGMSIEMCRWNLAYFWISILGFVLLIRVSARKNHIVRGVCIVFAVLALVNSVLYLQSDQDSIVRKDYREDGLLAGDEIYWMKHEVRQKEAEFDVLSYNMILEADRKLEAEVSLTIKTTPELDIYSFTLYRGYSIVEVTTENGTPISFRRDGDYLDVLSSFEEDIVTIYIQYEGNGNKYYSNTQGIALPGYFPYYPMPGYLMLWSEDDGDAYINTKFIDKQFTIQIISPLDVVSNLEETGNNRFTGVAATVSLLGGFIEETTLDYAAYTNFPISKIDIDVTELEEYCQEIKTTIGEMRNLSFYGKKIMRIPETITAASGSADEHFVYFEDHILLSSYGSKKMICSALIDSLIPYSRNKQLLRNIFLAYLSGNIIIDENYVTPSYEELQVLKEDLRTLEVNGQIEQYFIAEKKFQDLFLKKIGKMGEDYVLKQVYQYLIDESIDTNEVDFLYNNFEVDIND